MRWTIWLLAALFFFYEFVIRVAPSVMVGDLMNAFSINAVGVGSLAAFYLYIYAPMQIPVGMLTDHYGARKLLTVAALSCGLGCLGFAIATEYWVAAFGRLLMGFGSAFAFVGLLYISSHWFPKRKLSFLIGLGNSIGMLGAVIGQGPTSLATELFDWRGTYLIYAIVGLGVAAIILILVRNSPPSLRSVQPLEEESPRQLKTYLMMVSKNPQAWINALGCFLFYATTVAFAGLWGIPFLENVHKMDEHVGSFAISMIFVGWIIGGPLVGKWSDKLKRRKPFLLTFSLLAFTFLLPIIWVTEMSVFTTYFLLFLVGFFSSAEILHFTMAIEISPCSKATAVAFTNFITMLGGALLQPLIGFLLDFFEVGPSLDSLGGYSIATWQITMTLFPLAFLLCFVVNLFLKEPRYHKTSDCGVN